MEVEVFTEPTVWILAIVDVRLSLTRLDRAIKDLSLLTLLPGEQQDLVAHIRQYTSLLQVTINPMGELGCRMSTLSCGTIRTIVLIGHHRLLALACIQDVVLRAHFNLPLNLPHHTIHI